MVADSFSIVGLEAWDDHTRRCATGGTTEFDALHSKFSRQFMLMGMFFLLFLLLSLPTSVSHICNPSLVTCPHSRSSLILPIHLMLSFKLEEIKQEGRAIAQRTARCCCKFRYVSNFTTASCDFSAIARLSCIGLHQLKC